jgi:hypothetical protein
MTRKAKTKTRPRVAAPAPVQLDPFVQNLRDRIKASGFTVGDVCALTNPPVHQSIVYRWFAGDTLPTLRVLRPVLDALDRIAADGDAR